MRRCVCVCVCCVCVCVCVCVRVRVCVGKHLSWCSGVNTLSVLVCVCVSVFVVVLFVFVFVSCSCLSPRVCACVRGAFIVSSCEPSACVCVVRVRLCV